MIRGLLLAIVAVVGFLDLSGPAMAHHGDADRYVQEVMDVTGTVVELKMVNPHAHIIFDAEEGGKTVRWQAELGGPQQLTKQFGWTPLTVKKGMKLTIDRPSPQERRSLSQSHRAGARRRHRHREGNLPH